MEIAKINSQKVDIEVLKKAASILKKGGLVVFPTETVYGLGADAFNKKAQEKIYTLKNRSLNKPLTYHISDYKFLNSQINKNKHLGILIEKFWPGPLTVILDINGEKKAFRMPDNEIALKLIELSGGLISATSVNLSSLPAAVKIEDIDSKILDKVDFIIDAGEGKIGIESTVVDFTVDFFTIVRKGALSAEEMEIVLNEK